MEGKICLVTGSGGGIGRATAIEMARRGAAAVMISDVDDATGAETVELVRAAGAKAEYSHCDMGDGDQIRALIDTTVGHFGGLDVLHNNAGIQESYYTGDLTIDTLPEEVWDKVYAVNLKAVWLATKYAAPHLKRSDNDPNIVNCSSTGGMLGFVSCPVYGACKAAIIQMTKQTAMDLAPTVRCNSYAPASVMTNMVQRFRDASDDIEALDRASLATHLIPRYGEPEDVAKLVCFLASKDASWVTGSNYMVDGGVLAWRGAHAT